MSTGHLCIGFSYYVAGENLLAVQSFQNAIQVSADVLFTSAARLLLGVSVSYVASGRFTEAEGTLATTMRESQDYGVEWLGLLLSFSTV